MSTVSSQNREKVLAELESFYESKLAAVRAKRTGSLKPAGMKEIVTGEPVRVTIDSTKKELTVSWK